MSCISIFLIGEHNKNRTYWNLRGWSEIRFFFSDKNNQTCKPVRVQPTTQFPSPFLSSLFVYVFLLGIMLFQVTIATDDIRSVYLEDLPETVDELTNILSQELSLEGMLVL